MTERCSFSLTTFSPSGKLDQVEHALKVVDSGAPTIGIKAKDGVVLATENKLLMIKPPLMMEELSVSKVEQISKTIGMTYSGIDPDFRVLVKDARTKAQTYELKIGELISTTELVKQVATTVQEYKCSFFVAFLCNFLFSSGVRPFGVSLLIAGWDNGRPYLFECDPKGKDLSWQAKALGKNSVNAQTFLEKRYNEGLELGDATRIALLALKEVEVVMTEDNVSIGMCNRDGFHRLTKQNVKDRLSTL